MQFRTLILVLALFSLTGCPALEHKGKSKSGKTGQPEVPDMPDQSKDVSFQAFIGRLRTAVRTRDLATMASMMTPDFGYSINPDREGDGVFQFWDQNDIWKELESVLRDRFVPHENFMVAPAQFVADPDRYTGFRAGMRLVNGSWKFAYFVSGAGATDAKPGQ